MSNEMECRRCRFWLAPQTEEGKDLGECHRRSPRLGANSLPAWPGADAGNFCGEYKPKDRGVRGAGAEEDKRRWDRKTTSVPISMR